ncbi:MAG: hypothetical protein GMKNLPBB_02827 [Myxococcota bacterium]|nr:hypothetical protein [Myxococcota bacterium]
MGLSASILNRRLIEIGLAISSESDLDRLLERIVTEARAFTNADAGSLYIRDGDSLTFIVSQNETLERRLGKEQVKANFKPFKLPISNTSIAGHVAATGRVLNLPDVYKIDEREPFRFNPAFDKNNDYRTRSMLVAPLKDRSDKVTGVLQLINARTPGGRVAPFSPNLEDLVLSLASQAAVCINNVSLYNQIKDAHFDTIFRLSVAAEYRDKDTSNHLKRMSNYSKMIARKMGFSDRDQELVLYSSPMHDVGKIGIPDAILLKPGRLTPEERKIMETHTLIGAEILRGSDSEVLQWSELIAMSHHEKYDGNGYPKGLKGEEIPLVGRIVALADVFDALASRRCYKDAMPFDAVVDMIDEDSGKHFDPQCVTAFKSVLEEIHVVYEKYRD